MKGETTQKPTQPASEPAPPSPVNPAHRTDSTGVRTGPGPAETTRDDRPIERKER